MTCRILFFQELTKKGDAGHTQFSCFKNRQLTTIRIHASLEGLLRSTMLAEPHITSITTHQIPKIHGI